MTEIAIALFALLALLLPVAIYCFVLAAINRRGRPLIVRGTWDAIGLVFATSGFFLVTVPTLALEFIRRVLASPDLGLSIWVWALIYYFLVAFGAVLMILSRSNKTIVYNVDPELFSQILARTLASLGLAMKLDGKRLVLIPAEPSPTDTVSTAVTPMRPRPAMTTTDGRHAELAIENFASMCNVTLHWRVCSADLRDELERELDKNLESAAPVDNSAAGWFVSISGMIFGAVLVILSMFIFMIVFSRRWD